MKLFYNLFFIAAISLVTTTTNKGCKDKIIESAPTTVEVETEVEAEKENPLLKLLKGLRPLSTHELNGRTITIDGVSMPVYDDKGNKMEGIAIIEAHQDSTKIFEIFGTDALEPLAVLVRDKTTSVLADDSNFPPMPAESPMAIKLEYAPAFSIADMNGNVVNLDSLKGKVVVLNFWFTRCNPCIEEMRELNGLVKQYKDNEDVVFLAPTFDDKATVTTFLKKKTFDYTILPDAKSILDEYIVMGYPSNLVLDKKGDIQYQSMGFRHQIDAVLNDEIKYALKKK
ncbi:MAG: peroxiredoxin [Maribacter sp.]|jgi:peroxiredoxin